MLHNFPFDTCSLRADTVQALEDTYAALRAKFNISVPNDINLHINKFETININPDISVGGVLQINNTANECYLAFVKIHNYYHSVRSGEDQDFYQYKVWAFITLKNDFGRILIRRETFTDRVVNLIHPVELKFPDDKAFSNKFYVVTNDEQKALLAMNWNFRNAMMDMDDDIEMEALDHTLIISNNKNIDAEQTVQLAELASKIAGLK
ncbi:hypothetical protein HDF18_18550 [Mucilaginibacter sp. X5P1]|uniref:hypothetical protein n=1 Tax=Mucilaginibacter sp. X5P1 TaxID=2723088 RepID=UPI00161CC533|nr:hypothetical protein [Mucilaginibacter sp. X5P1]MBB6139645.1 hypothetical protein [Mucilaginibacter sp. X5P1]